MKKQISQEKKSIFLTLSKTTGCRSIKLTSPRAHWGMTLPVCLSPQLSLLSPGRWDWMSLVFTCCFCCSPWIKGRKGHLFEEKWTRTYLQGCLMVVESALHDRHETELTQADPPCAPWPWHWAASAGRGCRVLICSKPSYRQAEARQSLDTTWVLLEE